MGGLGENKREIGTLKSKSDGINTGVHPPNFVSKAFNVYGGNLTKAMNVKRDTKEIRRF